MVSVAGSHRSPSLLAVAVCRLNLAELAPLDTEQASSGLCLLSLVELELELDIIYRHRELVE